MQILDVRDWQEPAFDIPCSCSLEERVYQKGYNAGLKMIRENEISMPSNVYNNRFLAKIFENGMKAGMDFASKE